MDTQRLILFVIFSLSLFMLWDAWQRDQQPTPAVATNAAPAPQADKSVPTPSQTMAAPAGDSTTINKTASPLTKGTRIVVKTDLFDAEIDTKGADLRRMSFKKHSDTIDKSKPFTLLSDEAPHFYVAQSGLIGEGLPTHKDEFTSDASSYEMSPGTDTLTVRLSWRGQSGVQVDKLFTFKRGSYLINIAYEIQNTGGQAIKADAYFQLLRDGTPPAGESMFMPTYTGPALYTEKDKFVKHSFSDIGNEPAKDSVITKDGWVAILQHYFLAAYLPRGDQQREFYTRKVSDELFATGVIVGVGEIASGGNTRVEMPLFAGPQEQETLSQLAPGLDLAVDYGWLTVLSVPIFWLLNWLYQLMGNWGWAIIVLTILIKLAFYPLSAASYKSMAKMKVLGPRLQRLKEIHGNDRQKMHQAMMEMYKTEKINPLGGCLPILIQIPVFIALYWVLLYSVEMRHAPWAMWITDLTAPDPYYILPIIMGVSMLVQTKLNPTPPDPIQAKIMMIMPVAFSIFFIWFPAGLVLYWVVNNIISIAQQWRITHVLEQASKQAKR